MFDQGEAVQDSVDLIIEILHLIRKNKLHYYKMRRDHLLERQYRKSDVQERENYEIFYPVRQNFLLNIFWYNSLCIARYLMELRDIRKPRFLRWTKKVGQKFHHQYLRAFLTNPLQAPQAYGFAFHPSMIYTLTLPFPLLSNKDAQIFYRILIKQFLVNEGIKFPLRGNEGSFMSAILLGDYLDGWEALMKDKEFLFSFYHTISDKLWAKLKEGVMGYLPNFFQNAGDKPLLPYRASGVATIELMYFLGRLSGIEKKLNAKSRL